MLYIHLVIAWMCGKIILGNMGTKERIVTVNAINVIGFILFYSAKFFNSISIIYITLLLFLFNLFLTSNYFYQTYKNKEVIADYKYSITQFIFRIVFALFFIVYSLMTIFSITKL